MFLRIEPALDDALKVRRVVCAQNLRVRRGCGNLEVVRRELAGLAQSLAQTRVLLHRKAVTFREGKDKMIRVEKFHARG